MSKFANKLYNVIIYKKITTNDKLTLSMYPV